eukprot:GILI01001786.1.p1 GENE.GILI01001786.1~~GILI01001786.1.p1  ORF type:complete len:104 (+),score=1.69 GILI01001786.1:22-333(+)
MNIATDNKGFRQISFNKSVNTNFIQQRSSNNVKGHSVSQHDELNPTLSIKTHTHTHHNNNNTRASLLVIYLSVISCDIQSSSGGTQVHADWIRHEKFERHSIF